MQTRIYVVTSSKDLSDRQARLVEATSQSQAVRHVAAGDYAVKVASAKDVAHLSDRGIKVESAQAPRTEPVVGNGSEDQVAM